MSLIPPLRRPPPIILALATVAVVLVGTVAILLLSDDGPAVATERLRAKVVSVGAAVERDRRLVVTLEDGLTVVMRSNKVPLEAKAGDEIEVLRSKQPTGEIDYDLDG